MFHRQKGVAKPRGWGRPTTLSTLSTMKHHSIFMINFYMSIVIDMFTYQRVFGRVRLALGQYGWTMVDLFWGDMTWGSKVKRWLNDSMTQWPYLWSSVIIHDHTWSSMIIHDPLCLRLIIFVQMKKTSWWCRKLTYSCPRNTPAIP